MTLAISPASGNEAGDGTPNQFTATVSLTANAPTGGVEIPLIFKGHPQTAGATSADLGIPTEPVTINAGSRQGTAPITITNDEEFERSERFIVELGALPEGFVAGATDGSGQSAIFEIEANDVPPLEPGQLRVTAFTTPSALTEGGGLADITIVATRAASETGAKNYNFPLVFSDGTATAEEDYDAKTAKVLTVSFTASGATKTEATGTYRIEAKDDNIVEGAQRETFSVRVGKPADAASMTWLESAGARTRYIGIIDNDKMTLTLANEAITEGATATFTVSSTGNKTSNHAIEGRVFVDKSLDDRITGWESENDLLTSFILPAKATEATFTIATADDSAVNGGATIDDTASVSVKFAGAVRGLFADGAENRSANLKVSDNDTASLAFSSLPARLLESPSPAENGAGRLTLSHALKTATTIQVRKTGAGDHFTVALGTGKQAITNAWADYTIAATNTPASHQVFITPINDNAATGNQNLQLEARFKSGTPAYLVGASPETASKITSEPITFIDDEANFSFDSAFTTLDEGRATAVRVILERGGARGTLNETGKLVLEWSKDDGANWQAFSPAAEITNFSTSQSEHTFSVKIPGDETLRRDTYPVKFRLTVTQAASPATKISNLETTTFTSSNVAVVNTEGAELAWFNASGRLSSGGGEVEEESLYAHIGISLIDPDGQVQNKTVTRSVVFRIPFTTTSTPPGLSTAATPRFLRFPPRSGGSSGNQRTHRTSFYFDDSVITRRASLFTSVIGTPTIEGGGSLQFGKGVVRVSSTHSRFVATITNDDVTTPSLTAGKAIQEPGGTNNARAEQGEMTFSLNLTGSESLGEAYKFALSAAVTSGTPRRPLSNLVVDTTGSNATYSGGVLTFPAGTTSANDSVKVKVGFSGTQSDGIGTSVALTVRATDAGVNPATGAGGISFDRAATLNQDFNLRDADKARPEIAIGTSVTLAENASTVPNFNLNLSRATSAAVTVEVVASYTNKAGTTTKGTAKTISFSANDRSEQVTGLTLPSGLNDSLLNASGREVVITATLKTGTASEAEINSTDTHNIGVSTDDESANSYYTLNFTGASLAEGATDTLTATLSPAADSDVVLRLLAGGVETADYAFAIADSPADGRTYTRSGLQGNLTIPAGKTSASLTLTATGDNLVEGDQTLSLTSTQPSGPTYTNSHASAKTSDSIAITDEDDSNLSLKVQGDAWPTTLTEGGNAVPIPFILDLGASNLSLERAVAFDIQEFGIFVSEGSATKAAQDPTISATGWTATRASNRLTGGRLTFAAGTTHNASKAFSVQIPNLDTIAKVHNLELKFAAIAKSASDPLSHALSFTALPALSSNKAKIKIADDDKITLTLTGFPASVDEGATNSASKVVFSNAASQNLTVSLRITETVANKFIVRETISNKTLTTTAQAVIVTAGTTEIPITIQAIENSVTDNPIPQITLIAQFQSVAAGTLTDYVATTSAVTSPTVAFTDNEKSFAYSTPPTAWKEGIAQNLTIALNKGTLGGTGNGAIVVNFRPNGTTTDIEVGRGSIAIGASSTTISVTIPGDERLNRTARPGTLRATISQTTADPNIPAFVGNSLTLISNEVRVTNREGGYIFWQNAESNSQQSLTGNEGATFTPRAQMVLIPAGANPATQAPDYTKNPIIEADLTASVTLAGQTTGDHTPLVAQATAKQTSLTFKTGGDGSTDLLTTTASNAADFTYNDNLITRSPSAFTLLLAQKTNERIGEGVIRVSTTTAQNTLNLSWTNDDTASPTLTAGTPIVEPSGSAGTPGTMAFSLGLGGKTLGEPYSFELTPTYTGSGTLTALSLSNLSSGASYNPTTRILTFPKGASTGTATASVGFTGTTSDGAGTKVALRVRNVVGGSPTNSAVVGITLPAVQNYKVTDADKATPSLTVATTTLAETATVVPNFTLALSRDTAAAVTVEVQAGYNDGAQTHTGAAQTITFAPNTGTTPQTVTNLALPSQISDNLLNLRTRKVVITATLKTGQTSEAEINSSDTHEITITDDETAGKYSYAFNKATVKESKKSILTLTLTEKADTATEYTLTAGGAGVRPTDFSIALNTAATNAGATLTFTPSTGSGTLRVPKNVGSVGLVFTATDDDLVEGEESLDATLTYKAGDGFYALKAGEPTKQTLTIDDAQDDSPFVLAFNVNNFSTTKTNDAVAEGTPETFKFQLDLPAGSATRKGNLF